ncbi:MAG TPA: hypothetical protein VME17_26320 [Bryobacteraceae bacterium]|nr:hypothetical protein [Bryobacteraceae bacterium]
MNIPKQIRCPYTRQALSVIDASVEHIVPAALGGGGDFAVMAERKSNNDLGSSLDEPLISSPLIGLQRVDLGIKGYSGGPRLKLPGKVKGHAVPIEVTFSTDAIDTHVRKPVEMDPSGNSGRIVIPANQEAEFTKKLMTDYARKGKEIRLDESYTLGTEMELDFGFDVLLLKRAMAKIAFLAAFRVLGDEFLNDPLYDEWHNCIFATDHERLVKTKLRGVAFDAANLFAVSAPPIERYEHMAVVANLQMAGPVVMVSLFGTKFHHMMAIASDSKQYNLGVGEGQIAICDATTRKTRFIDYLDFLLMRSRGQM